MTSRVFTKAQYGKETTSGTAVAATKILAGAEPKPIPDDRAPDYIEDALGVRAKSARSAVYTILAEDTLVIPKAYFQVLPLIFSCGLKGGITPSEVTPSQADYLWPFAPSMTSIDTVNSITLQLGDNTQAYRIPYTMFKSVKISGEIPQDKGEAPVAIEVDYFGRYVEPSSFTGSLALPTMTTMNAKLSRLYKDTLWANKGTTELANILRAFELELIFGTHPKLMGSPDKHFNTHGGSYVEAMLTLTLERGAASDTIFDEHQADPPTAKAYSLQINGPTIASGTPHSLKVDIFGSPEMVEPITEESNGNNLDQVLIHGMYDTTGAQIVDVNVTTNSNAI